jgi:hypothetical protein
MSEVVDEGADTYSVRRRRRTAIVLAVVVLGLAGAFYYASSYWNASEPGPVACSTEVVPDALQPADVSINVYNATSRNGLAAAIAKVARQRGFKVKSVRNDPKKKTIKGVAEIRYGPDGKESAALLKLHVPKATLVDDKRKGDTIDLVAGDAWKSYGPVPAAPTPTNTLPPCRTVTVTQ